MNLIGVFNGLRKIMRPKVGGKNAESPDLKKPFNSIVSGAGVKRSSFITICRKYFETAKRNQFLIDLISVNMKFGETLILFDEVIEDAGNDKEKQDLVIDQMYRHYVINTDGPIPTFASDLSTENADDKFVLFDEASEYAKMLNVKVSRPSENSTILHFNEKEISCPGWSVLEGKSHAYSLRKAGLEINKARYGRNDVIPSCLFGFDENAKTHTLKNAMILADLAHLAYTKPGYIQSQLESKEWGYSSFEWVENKEIDTQSFIVTKGDHIVVCFRGTASRTDWITDANLLRTNSFDGKGSVHRGFKNALDGVWDRISDSLNSTYKDKKIFFTGHSLGAALAQMAAYRQATFELNRIAGVYVFGSPRIGNRDYKTAYDKLLADKTFLHINNTDFVTRVPHSILGYRQMGSKPLKFDGTHNLTGVMDAPLNRTQKEESLGHPKFDQTHHIANDDTLLFVGSQEEEMQRDPEFDRTQNTNDSSSISYYEEGKEVESINDLEPWRQDQVRGELMTADNLVQGTTTFLNVEPQQMEDRFYESSSGFDSGSLDEHGADQYLFKLGCAIVDGHIKRISGGL